MTKSVRVVLDQRGISMVQVMISVGLMGVVSLGMLRINENQQKASNTVSQNFEAVQIMTQVEGVLRNKEGCFKSFGSGTMNLKSDFTQIIDRNDRVIIKKGETYSGMGAGSKIKVESIGFQMDGANVLLKDTSAPFMYKGALAVTSTANIKITLDRTVNSSGEDANSYGGRKVNKILQGFRVVTRNNIDGNIIGCHAPADMYVEAACSALGGTISALDGKCNDLHIDQISVSGNADVTGQIGGGSIKSNTTVVVPRVGTDGNNGAFKITGCGGISQGAGPGGVNGMKMSSEGACPKTFLHAGNTKNSAYDNFSLSGYLFIMSGEIRFGKDGGGATITGDPSSGNLTYSAAGLSRHVFDKGDVQIENKLSVAMTSEFKGQIDMTNHNIIGVEQLRVKNVVGTGNLSGFSRISGIGTIQASGTITASDTRLKKNFVEIDSALDKVSQLGGYIFDWIDEDSAKQMGTQVGVKAQEVQKVFPELVKTGESGYLFVNYQGLVAPLIEAVKEQKELFDKQQLELNELKKQVQLLIDSKK